MMSQSVAPEIRPPSKHYRRPRRRPAHLRTKTGCLTCRRRKKKCDETRSICQNCSRTHLLCVWPEAEGNTRQISTQASDGDASTESSSTNSPASVEGACQDGVDLSVAVHQWPETPSVVDFCSYPDTPSISLYTPSILSFSPILTGDNIFLFNFLRMVFLPQLIRPLCHESVIERFNSECLKLAFTTPYFMHALLSCCGAEIPIQDPSHYQRIAKLHYAKAVAGLRADLAGDLQHKMTDILRTVIILCIYERSKPRLSQGVDIHLLGAAQLIQLYFHRDSFQPGPSHSDAVTQRLILEAFVFHTTTSVLFQQSTGDSVMIDSAFSLAERRLESFFHPEPGTPLYDHSPVLGVPPRLFAYVREVALMYQRYAVEGVNVIRCCELEYMLKKWDRDTERCLHDGDVNPQSTITNPMTTTTPTNVLQLGPRLYVLAARVLLARMTNIEAAANPCYRALLAEAMLLVSHLQPSSDYFAEYYCWPFLVLGMSVIDQIDRECLMAQIQAFWVATRNGTMRRLADMLPACWESGSCDVSCRLNMYM